MGGRYWVYWLLPPHTCGVQQVLYGAERSGPYITVRLFLWKGRETRGSHSSSKSKCQHYVLQQAPAGNRFRRQRGSVGPTSANCDPDYVLRLPALRREPPLSCPVPLVLSVYQLARDDPARNQHPDIVRSTPRHQGQPPPHVTYHTRTPHQTHSRGLVRPKNTQPASHRACQGRVDSASPDTGQHEMGGARLYGQPTTSPNTGLWSRNTRTPIGKAIVQLYTDI